MEIYNNANAGGMTFTYGHLIISLKGRGVFRYVHIELKEKGAKTFSFDISGAMAFFPTLSKMPHFGNP